MAISRIELNSMRESQEMLSSLHSELAAIFPR